jgi:DNA-binding NtrC family response regulator
MSEERTVEAAGRRVLLVDDEADALVAYTQALRRERYGIEATADPLDALNRLRAATYDAAVIDLRMPGLNGLDLLRAMRGIDPDLAVIVVTGYASVETAVEAMKEGACDYLSKPFTPDELRLGLRKALERQDLLRENRDLRDRLGGAGEGPVIVGRSGKLAEVQRLVARVAPTDCTVLVHGETGTGKELVAREIHARSPRAGHALISVDCAAIPGELLESELFGHERGAFTGAVRRRKGAFELAHGGTLFLDEIGNMALDVQAKVLRALQQREIQPVGGERKIAVDVRVIAATNRNLKEAVRRGGFREELYYRLNVVPVPLPPLRERPEDIPPLVHHFLGKYAGRLNRRIEDVSPEAMQVLVAYPWPGNVRELESAIQRAMTLGDGAILGPEAFRHLAREARSARAGIAARAADGALPPLEQVEHDYIMEVLQATRWNRREASRILGISTVTLWRKIGARGAEDCKG